MHRDVCPLKARGIPSRSLSPTRVRGDGWLGGWVVRWVGGLRKKLPGMSIAAPSLAAKARIEPGRQPSHSRQGGQVPPYMYPSTFCTSVCVWDIAHCCCAASCSIVNLRKSSHTNNRQSGQSTQETRPRVASSSPCRFFLGSWNRGSIKKSN